MSNPRIVKITTGMRGPRGQQGIQGVQGIPGPNTVPTTDAVAAALTEPGPADVLNNAIGEGVDARVDSRNDLPHWRTVMSALAAGEAIADPRILCVGDSTTIGTVPAAGAPESYPYQLADVLDDAGLDAAPGLAIPSRVAQTDPRWTVGSGWTEAQFGWGGGSAHMGAVGCGPLTFTDSNVTADRWDVYYFQSTVAGSLTVQATGGSAVVTNSNGSPAVKKVTVSAASAATSNVVTITNASAAAIYIVGIEPWHSSQRRVRVGNAGLAGSRAERWSLPLSGLGAPACIQAYAPDLTIISLGVNDAGLSTPSATYLAQLQVVIDAARVSGDVLVWSPLPSGAAAETHRKTYEVIYNDAHKAATGYPFLDLYPRWGAPGSPNPAFMQDALHANPVGNRDLAEFLGSAVLSKSKPLVSTEQLAEAVEGRALTAVTDTFTASGTWTKRAGAKHVDVTLIGPGGGGGAGARGPSGTALVGGGAGGGGALTKATIDAELLPSTVAVTVSAGGAGAAAQTVDGTAGGPGSPGAGATTFGSFLFGLRGNGGGGGGLATGGAAGTGGTGFPAGGNGGGGAAAGTAGLPGATSLGGSGGGGGAGITTAGAASAGGAGGSGAVWVSSPGSGGAATGVNGGVGGASPIGQLGGGGGGGGSNAAGAGGSGGNGGTYGAGGGGGAAALNGNASGKGGDGAPGIAIITTYF